MDTLPDFTRFIPYLLLTLAMFIIIVIRYFLVAGLFQLAFYKWFKLKWQHKKLGKKEISNIQFRKEVKWSLVTSLIFSIIASFTTVLWQKGFTKIYFDLNQYGLFYLPISLLLSMFIHETYYYFMHRWMHLPSIFKWVHKTHHNSSTTSAWTAFAFHPLEGFLQAIILPFTLMVLPMNIYVILTQLVIMTFSSVINHLEIEIYSNSFQTNFLGRWIIGATHHSLHHKQFKYNFGLYFTFWDKLIKTESPSFQKIPVEKSRGAKT